ncbi:hypothetical protein [Modestobacter italicus]|nr:hypothetical protein [Modestobacter italicus]
MALMGETATSPASDTTTTVDAPAALAVPESAGALDPADLPR